MKELKLYLQDICNELNLPMSKEQAIKQGQGKYIYLEFASHYGGYRIVSVDVNHGGHYGAFGEGSCCPRRSKKEMTAYLEGLLNGIIFKK